MKYFFETYGCQMNNAESAALALAARESGWQEAESADSADLVLLNTCSVRETAEQRARGRIAHYAALKKKRAPGTFALVLAGCMAERLGEKAKNDFSAVDFVMGTSARARFPLILSSVERGEKAIVETDEKPEFSFSSVHLDLQEDGRAFCSFVPIMHGCNNFCSFCIVPYVRGREVSRDPESILSEIRLVGERGVREITLLGQNVNSYSLESSSRKLDFPALLELIAKNIGSSHDTQGVKWIRFLSSHPKDFSQKAIQVIAENPSLCRHIHLCVQHGSNTVLEAMNRRYTREQYLELVRKLREAIPDVSLSTDILIGFPGETEDDVDQTLSLMEEVKFLYAYMYHFNPREGTHAFSLPERIPTDVKKERLSRVIALQKLHTQARLKERVGQTAKVLIEGISKKNADELISRTERDEMVVIPGNASMIGRFEDVTLSSLRGNTFRARISRRT